MPPAMVVLLLRAIHSPQTHPLYYVGLLLSTPLYCTWISIFILNSKSSGLTDQVGGRQPSDFRRLGPERHYPYEQEHDPQDNPGIGEI